METDENISNKTLTSELGAAHGTYMMDWLASPDKSLFLQFCLSIFNL